MNNKNTLILTISGISFVCALVAAICFIIAPLLDVSMHVFGIASLVFILITHSMFLVRCPLCTGYMYKPVWKRKENDTSPIKLLKDGLVYKKWVCSNCGETINEN